MKLKKFPLHRLKPGQSTLVGPYKSAKTVSGHISRFGVEGAKYKQQKMLLINAITNTVYQMFLVTRVQ